jgi:hypothetical protein
MKNYRIFLIFILMFANFPVRASVRSIYQDRSNLLVMEKVGKTENLLNNPARLSELHDILLEYDLTISVNNVKPYDAVYKKNVTDETACQNAQLIVPVKNRLVFNAGCEYVFKRKGSVSTSRQDGSEISDRNKASGKKGNGAVAANWFPFCSAGYALTVNEYSDKNNFHADPSENYSYLNKTDAVCHTFGVSKNGFDLFGSFSKENYGGYFQQVKEADFAVTAMEINARCVLGEADKRNLVLQLTYQRDQIKRRRFVLGRTGYDLDFPDSKISAAGYYYYPKDAIELAAGVEADYTKNEIFDMPDYAWKHYTVIRGAVPVQVSAPLFPWLNAWLELDLIYLRNMYEKSSSIALQNSFGMQLKISGVEVQIYALPSFSLAASKTSDAAKTITAGISALFIF